MRIATMGLLVMMAGVDGQAEDCSRKVTIYSKESRIINGAALRQAEEIASRVFASAGVGVVWRTGSLRTGEPQCGVTLVVNITWGLPKEFKPGVLAYSFPYDAAGTGITVMYDRVRNTTDRGYKFDPVLLGYVLAHEITHVLQHMDRHSDGGVMRRRWTDADYDRMQNGTLTLTADDVDVIRMGLDARTSRLAQPGLSEGVVR